MDTPQVHIRRKSDVKTKAEAIENQNGIIPHPIPTTHDDAFGVQHAARRHHPDNRKD